MSSIGTHRACEEMDEIGKSQAAYSEFLDIWKNADPELEPIRQLARDALLRLGPLEQ